MSYPELLRYKKSLRAQEDKIKKNSIKYVEVNLTVIYNKIRMWEKNGNDV